MTNYRREYEKETGIEAVFHLHNVIGEYCETYYTEEFDKWLESRLEETEKQKQYFIDLAHKERSEKIDFCDKFKEAEARLDEFRQFIKSIRHYESFYFSLKEAQTAAHELLTNQPVHDAPQTLKEE